MLAWRLASCLVKLRS
ncbi:hypothetical protein, partial [Escherichia coli]